MEEEEVEHLAVKGEVERVEGQLAAKEEEEEEEATVILTRP